MELKQHTLKRLQRFFATNSFDEAILLEQGGDESGFDLELDDVGITLTELQIHGKSSEADRSTGVVIAAKVCTLAKQSCAASMGLLLSANHFWRGTRGATFSYEPLRQEIYLNHYLTRADLDSQHDAQLAELLLELHDLVVHWRVQLEQVRQCPAEQVHSNSQQLSWRLQDWALGMDQLSYQ